METLFEIFKKIAKKKLIQVTCPHLTHVNW